MAERNLRHFFLDRAGEAIGFISKQTVITPIATLIRTPVPITV